MSLTKSIFKKACRDLIVSAVSASACPTNHERYFAALVLRDVHDQARGQIQPRLDQSISTYSFSRGETRCRSAGPIDSITGALAAQRSERGVVAAAFRLGVDEELLAELAIDLLCVSGQRA